MLPSADATTWMELQDFTDKKSGFTFVLVEPTLESTSTHKQDDDETTPLRDGAIRDCEPDLCAAMHPLHMIVKACGSSSEPDYVAHVSVLSQQFAGMLVSELPEQNVCESACTNSDAAHC